MLFQQKQVFLIVIGLFFVLGGSGVFAGSQVKKMGDLKSPSLGESVDRIVQIMVHVDTNLLSTENIDRVEATGNYEAIAALHRSISDRDLIGAEINQGRFEEAYVAMKVIENRMSAFIKLSWVNEYKLQKMPRLIESKLAISDTYGSSLFCVGNRVKIKV